MHTTRNDLLVYAAFLLLLAGIAATCLPELQQTAQPLSERVRRTGVVRLAYAPEAPYAFRAPDGTVTGAWPEVARKVLRKMGIERTEWIQCEFGALLDDLDAGRCDIIASGMFITPERSKRAAFSLPVAVIEAGLLVRKGNPSRLAGYADAARREQGRIAVLQGAAEVKMLLTLNIPPQRLLPVPDAASGVAAVRAGQAEALALSLPTLRYVAREQKDVEALPAYPHDSPVRQSDLGAFVFRTVDDAFLQDFDRELRRFLASPEYAATVVPFGFAPDAPVLAASNEKGQP